MIRGITQEYIPYVLEDDRASEVQTVFHIKAKTGHDSNKTMQRYIGATKENARKGTRDVNVSKLDNADIEEFLAICKKVENYAFPKGHPLYGDKGEPIPIIESLEQLTEVVRTISADHLQEIFEVATNINKLADGAKKN